MQIFLYADYECTKHCIILPFNTLLLQIGDNLYFSYRGAIIDVYNRHCPRHSIEKKRNTWNSRQSSFERYLLKKKLIRPQYDIDILYIFDETKCFLLLVVINILNILIGNKEQKNPSGSNSLYNILNMFIHLCQSKKLFLIKLNLSDKV